MGAGDWIMATAQVREASEKAGGRRVVVAGRNGQPQWNEVFDNNPRIARMHTRFTVRILNGPGMRPYIAAKSDTKWTWRPWNIAPGELWLTPQEKSFGRPYAGMILVEPTTKVPTSNKRWIWGRWQELVYRWPLNHFVQVGKPGTPRLHNATFVETPSFRHACAVLAACKAFVGTEGGLHHAAAALGVPAVVLFSEFISPEITGYPTHRNIRHAGEPCGMRVPCAGCQRSMEAITVDEVERNLREIT